MFVQFVHVVEMLLVDFDLDLVIELKYPSLGLTTNHSGHY